MLSISISSSTPLLKTHHHHPEWWQKWLMGSTWQHCLLMSETQWKTRYSLPHHHQGWVPSQFGLYSCCWMSAPWTQLCSQMKLEGGNDMNHLSIMPVYWWDSTCGSAIHSLYSHYDTSGQGPTLHRHSDRSGNSAVTFSECIGCCIKSNGHHWEEREKQWTKDAMRNSALLQLHTMINLQPSQMKKKTHKFLV